MSGKEDIMQKVYVYMEGRWVLLKLISKDTSNKIIGNAEELVQNCIDEVKEDLYTNDL